MCKVCLTGFFKLQFIPSDLSRCACGQLTTQHVAIPPGANSLEETHQLVHIDTPKDKWSVIKHTRTYPTDAFGIIEFQGGGFINKAMVSLSQKDSASIFDPVDTSSALKSECNH